jgi:hypothetical protein
MPINNIMFTPNPGVLGFTHDVVCQAPKGAGNQLQTVYRGDASIQPNGSGYGAMMASRLYHGELVNNIGQ